MYDNPWLYDEKPFTEDDIPEGIVGFVCLITNLTNGRMYIGKKNFTKAKKLYRKNKRAKRVHTSSDWYEYYGSNGLLQADVASLGSTNFKREILRLCRSKGEMSYYETKEQLNRDVLLREDYYNIFVGCRIHRNHVTKSLTPKEKIVKVAPIL
jgi:Putative endonuclease segE, GIY-YIG domain